MTQLAAVTPTATPAPAPLKAVTTLDEMVSALHKAEQNTSFVADTIEGWTYERDSEFGSLNKPGQKMVLTEYSAKQLCKSASVPFSVFKRASQELAADLFGEFIPGLKDKERKFAVRALPGKTLLRALLPLDYPDIRNSEVLEQAIKVFPGTMALVNRAQWMDENDAPYLNTRLIFPGQGKEINNDQVYLGLDIGSSELGAGELLINVLLFRRVCENGAIATYENHPYFSYDYKGGGLSLDFSMVLETCFKRMEKDVDAFWSAVTEAMGRAILPKDAVAWAQQLEEKRHLNKGVTVKVQRYLEKTPAASNWDFVNAITATARGYREQLRTRYETTAGRILGLNFSRATAEEGFVIETTGKTIATTSAPSIPATVSPIATA